MKGRSSMNRLFNPIYPTPTRARYCAEWIEFYWQPSLPLNMFSTSHTNMARRAWSAKHDEITGHLSRLKLTVYISEATENQRCSHGSAYSFLSQWSLSMGKGLSLDLNWIVPRITPPCLVLIRNYSVGIIGGTYIGQFLDLAPSLTKSIFQWNA